MSTMTLSRTPVPISSPASASIRRALLSSRVEKKYAIQTRTLWWWSRHGSWSSSNDEALEERMQKYQKIMKYRYSRALKRRALWERDNSPPLSAVRSSGRWLGRVWGSKPLSTSEQLRAKLKDEESGIPRHDSPWEQMHKDFEAFKAAVDREIAKDPYRVLFGRRFHGPSTSPNSTWTTISRLFDPPPTKDDPGTSRQATSQARIIKIETAKNLKPSPSSKQSLQPAKNSAEDDDAQPTEVYVYDPVSGRKVLRSTTLCVEEPQPQKPFLETLFSEHGVDTYTTASPVQGQQKDNNVQVDKFETSKEHEYKTLRAATVGSNIDTTAEFGGKYQSEAETQDELLVNSRARPGPDHHANEQPFFGTTYAARFGAHISDLAPRTWLSREGFTEPCGAVSSTSAVNGSSQAHERLQPSFDRLQHELKPSEKKFLSKLQPAIDRIEVCKPKPDGKTRPAPLSIVPTASPTVEQDLPLDTREDMDLLRASDIRAATRTTRPTRQAADQAKAKTREQLDLQFERLNAARAVDFGFAKWIRKSTIMQTSGLETEAFKKYQKYGRPSAELLERIDATEAALSEVRSIYDGSGNRRRSLDLSTHSEATKHAQEARQEITKELRAATRATAEEIRIQNAQLMDLGRVVRGIFEDEKGPIMAQSTPTEQAVPASVKSAFVAGTSPLSVATVKPGVPRHIQIERYTQEFEPKFAKLVDQAKKIKGTLHEVSSNLYEMKEQTARFKKNDSTRNAELSSAPMQRSQTEPVLIPQMGQGRSDIIAKHKSSDFKLTPTAEALSADSRFVILTYNKQTGKVEATHLKDLLGQPGFTTKSVNPIMVMGNLNYPAAFVSHFTELERAGYALANGGGDILIFQKQEPIPGLEMSNEERPGVKVGAGPREMRNRISADEARNQPLSQSISSTPWEAPSSTEKKSETQTSAPVTPVSASTSANDNIPASAESKKKERKSTKVKRQERVFSGTLRPNQTVNARASDPTTFESAQEKYTRPEKAHALPSPADQPGAIRRFLRVIKRAILATAALGSAAYAIGVAAEGIGAQAQQQGRDDSAGPRTKVVMPVVGQRPGIFSTESSRRE